MVLILKMIVYQYEMRLIGTFSLVYEMCRNLSLCQTDGSHIHSESRCGERFSEKMFVPYDRSIAVGWGEAVFINIVIFCVAADSGNHSIERIYASFAQHFLCGFCNLPGVGIIEHCKIGYFAQIFVDGVFAQKHAEGADSRN